MCKDLKEVKEVTEYLGEEHSRQEEEPRSRFLVGSLPGIFEEQEQQGGQCGRVAEDEVREVKQGKLGVGDGVEGQGAKSLPKVFQDYILSSIVVQSGPSPVLINKLLLEHSHFHLYIGYDCFCAIQEERSSCCGNHLAHKA